MKLFIILFLCTFFIFSFSHFGAKAFQAMTNNDNSLAEGTMIGIVDVSGKTENEAIQIVDEALTSWLDNTANKLYFREKSILLDNALFRFEIAESVRTASSGQKNEVIVHIDSKAFEEIVRQGLPTINKNDFDFDKLQYDLLENANKLQSGDFSFSLEDYAQPGRIVKNKVISESIVQIVDSGSALTRLTNKIKKIEIPSESQFSLISFINDNGLKNESTILHNALASGMYELVLQTNFQLVERHISNEKPEFAKLGFEAKIDIGKSMDLSFANMNRTSYFIEVKQTGDSLHLSLIGPPLLNNYVISTEEEVFKPKTIKHYNPLLKRGQKSVEKEGKGGMLVSVIRTVYDEKGERLKQETISEDFYPPIPQIEVHALIEKDSSQASETQTDINNEQDDSGASDKENSSGESSISEQDNDGVFDSGNDLWGKPKEQMK